MRFIFAILLLLVSLACSCTRSFAIDLVGHRMANSGARCTWACIETAGRALGVKEVEGLMHSRPFIYAGYMYRVQAVLARQGVKSICHADYVYDRDTLRKYAPTNGCVVTIMAGSDFIDFRGCHSILVLDYGDNMVTYYDPNHRDEKRTVERKKFDRWWSGNLIVVLKNEGTT